MTGRRDGLQQEHPEVRHEIARHPVIRVVKQDFQFPISAARWNQLAVSNCAGLRNGMARGRVGELDPDVKQAIRFARNISQVGDGGVNCLIIPGNEKDTTILCEGVPGAQLFRESVVVFPFDGPVTLARDRAEISALENPERAPTVTDQVLLLQSAGGLVNIKQFSSRAQSATAWVIRAG